MAGRKKRGSGAGKSGKGAGKSAKTPDKSVRKFPQKPPVAPPTQHYEHFIEFTPEGGFDIRSAARNFANLMEQSNQPLIIHLPHVSVEFEPGCTPKEIVDGYNLALRAKIVVKPSNANVKQPT
ncbi:MAG: hypothetical protein ACAH80_14925 [Alphaproteobacteria bacterium]